MKRVTFREVGATSLNWFYKDSLPIGWFSTKTNILGYGIFKLDDWMKNQFIKDKIDLEDVYRISSQIGTTIVKFNFETGTVAFIDNEKIMDEDRYEFARFTPYREVFLDTLSK